MQDRELLMKIMQLTFACVDLTLYLDTHPNDHSAFQEFKKRSEELMQAKAEYEKMCGPLLGYGFGIQGFSYDWEDDPWPWEINWRRS